MCRPTDVRRPQDVTVKKGQRGSCYWLACKVGLTLHVVVASAWNVLSGCSTGVCFFEDVFDDAERAVCTSTVLGLGLLRATGPR